MPLTARRCRSPLCRLCRRLVVRPPGVVRDDCQPAVGFSDTVEGTPAGGQAEQLDLLCVCEIKVLTVGVCEFVQG